MKRLNLISAVVIVLLSFNANATKYKFIAADSSIETKTCVFAGNNNKIALKKALRQSIKGFAYDGSRFAANNITCNNMVMAHFAHKYDALNTFSYLNALTNSKDKIPTTSVDIKDIAAVLNRTNEDIKIIYVGSAN